MTTWGSWLKGRAISLNGPGLTDEERTDISRQVETGIMEALRLAEEQKQTVVINHLTVVVNYASGGGAKVIYHSGKPDGWEFWKRQGTPKP